VIARIDATNAAATSAGEVVAGARIT